MSKVATTADCESLCFSARSSSCNSGTCTSDDDAASLSSSVIPKTCDMVSCSQWFHASFISDMMLKEQSSPTKPAHYDTTNWRLTTRTHSRRDPFNDSLARGRCPQFTQTCPPLEVRVCQFAWVKSTEKGGRGEGRGCQAEMEILLLSPPARSFICYARVLCAMTEWGRTPFSAFSLVLLPYTHTYTHVLRSTQAS